VHDEEKINLSSTVVPRTGCIITANLTRGINTAAHTGVTLK
jgi:hypothetical protein